jgi:hypothetical protein
MHTRIALGTFLAALISLGTAYGQRGVGEQIDVARQLSKPELVTLKGKGWTGEDVLPGVKIVVGAYPRIIDLQLRGYAYIRF